MRQNIQPATPAAADSLAAVLLDAATRVAAVLAGRSLAAAPLDAIPPERRSQVHELVYGCLRRFGWGDFLLAQLMQRAPEDQLLRALLLVALYRLDMRPDAAHAVVHQAVDAAARIAHGRYRSLVNAVLRNALRRHDELAALAAADPVAAGWHPAWWLAALRAAYPGEWAAIVAADNAQPPVCLRVNRRRADAEACLARLRAAGIEAEATGDFALRLPRAVAVERLPGFAAGELSVQDAGAQLAAPLLAATAGQRVLDACAAPGGKAAHLLELADVELTAVDADAARCRKVTQTLARLGLAASVCVGDAGAPAAWWDGRPFDRILLDAPCTASGVVRRHPDAKWLRRPEDTAAFAGQQRRLLDALWPLLAAGGRLLYVTCSVFPAENAQQVAAFLARTPAARCRPIECGHPAGGGAQLLPGEANDGFFYALLEKAR